LEFQGKPLTQGVDLEINLRQVVTQTQKYTGNAKAFITALRNTENARAGGEFKGLILTSTVWYEIFAAGFHFCGFVFGMSKTDHAQFICL